MTWHEYTEVPTILTAQDLLNLNENQFYIAELYREKQHKFDYIDIESVFAKNPLVPDGYTQLEYIESTGSQYLRADIPISINANIYVKFSTKTSANDSNLLGGRYSDGSEDLTIWLNTASNKGIAIHYPIDSESSTNTGWIYHNVEVDKPINLKITPEKIYVNGVRVYQFNENRTAFSSALNGYVFARNQAGTATANGKFKIYYIKTWVQGSGAQFLVPVYRESNNRIGMLDVLNNDFYFNRGTGEFVRGADTIEPETTPYADVKAVYQTFEDNMSALLRKIDNDHWHHIGVGSYESARFDWQRWIDDLNRLKEIVEEL